jgi:hypothetical protein
MYRRHIKTIRHLGAIDKLFGVAATTRNWNTLTAVVDLLKNGRNTTTAIAAAMR